MRNYKLAAFLLVLGGVIGFIGAEFVPYLEAQVQAPPKSATPIPKELTSYRDVVKKVLPAVVSIRVVSAAKSKTVKDDAPLPDDAGPDSDLRRFMEEMRKRQRGMDSPVQQFGSGVVVDAGGLVVTNNHVVSGAEQVEVTFKDGKRTTSKSIVFDPRTDLAYVKLSGTAPFPAAELGDSDEMEIGDRVLAIGAPFGLTGSVSQGIISAKGRSLNMNLFEDFLQTDAAINPGNSGGPLVNLAGQVVGINTAIKSQNGGFQGVGMAIPSNMVREVVTDLLRDGKIRRGYLGVQMQDLTEELADKMNLKERQGVVVMSAQAGAPGAKGGVKEGDIIVSVSGTAIDGGKTLQRIVRTASFDKPLDFVVLRDGKRQNLKVAIEQMPEEFGMARTELQPRPRAKVDVDSVALGKLGLEVADLTLELAEQFGFKDAKGALITQVDPDGLAQSAGLRRGMLITGAEQKAVESADALQELVKKGSVEKGVLLRVRTAQGGTRYVIVKSES